MPSSSFSRSSSINDGSTPLSDAAEPLLLVSFEEQEVEKLSAQRSAARVASAGYCARMLRPASWRHVPIRTDACIHAIGSAAHASALACFIGAGALLRASPALLIAAVGAIMLLASLTTLTAIHVSVSSRWGARVRLWGPSCTHRSIAYTVSASTCAAVSIACAIVTCTLLPLHVTTLMFGFVAAASATPVCTATQPQVVLPAAIVRACVMIAFVIACLPYAVAPLTVTVDTSVSACSCSNAGLLPHMPPLHVFTQNSGSSGCDAAAGCDCAGACGTAAIHTALGCVAAAACIGMHMLSAAALTQAVAQAARYNMLSAFGKHRTSVRKQATTSVHSEAPAGRMVVHGDTHVSSIEDTQTLVHPPTLRASSHLCTGAMLAVAGIGVALANDSIDDASHTVSAATSSVGNIVGVLLIVFVGGCACARANVRPRPLPPTMAAPSATSSGFAPAYETTDAAALPTEQEPTPVAPPPPVRARATARLVAASPLIPTRPWQRAESAVIRLESDAAAVPSCTRVCTRVCAHACAAFCSGTTAPLAVCSVVAAVVTYAYTQACVAPLTCNALLLTDGFALLLVWGAHMVCMHMHMTQRVWSRLATSAAPPEWKDPLVLTHARTIGGLPRAAFEKAEDDDTPLDAPAAGLPGTTTVVQ